MKPYAEMTKEELVALRKELKAQYREMQVRIKAGYVQGQSRAWSS